MENEAEKHKSINFLFDINWYCYGSIPKFLLFEFHFFLMPRLLMIMVPTLAYKLITKKTQFASPGSDSKDLGER